MGGISSRGNRWKTSGIGGSGEEAGGKGYLDMETGLRVRGPCGHCHTGYFWKMAVCIFKVSETNVTQYIKTMCGP